jgi:membrane-bound ClpP family serine protease
MLQQNSSLLTDYSDKIKNLNDTLQRNETRLDEREVENKALEGKLRDQESKIDHLHTNLNTAELKLKDSLSKVKELDAEIEIKTAHVLQLETVSCMLLHVNVLFVLLLILFYGSNFVLFGMHKLLTNHLGKKLIGPTLLIMKLFVM